MTSARRDRQVAGKKQDILEAAARAFARKDFHSTTMQDIAKEAEYAIPSLYAYFPTKQAIFEGLVELVQTELQATFVSSAPPGMALEQRLQLLLRQQLELADERRDAFTVFFAIRDRVPARDRGLEDYARRLEAWVKQFDFREVAASDLAYATAGIAYAFFVRWLREGSDRKLAADAYKIVELALHGALATGPVRAGARGVPKRPPIARRTR